QSDLPTFGRVTYRAVYPGVDVSYHGNQGQLEYDIIVAPGTDPSVVDLGFPGVQGVRVDDGGQLVLPVAGAEVRHRAPVIFQDGVEGRVRVSGGFVVRENGNVGFAIGAYDPTRTLVIDPTLAYSTFLGSISADYGQGVAVDYLGNAYVAGGTSSPDFPTTPGAADTSFNGFPIDGFVAKLSRDGSALLYSTFLGGSNRDDSDSVAIDLRGNAYVRGITQSPNFPTTPGAFDGTFNGSIDGYVVKLSPNGSLVYSTFLGGVNFDSGSGIAVDYRGAAYVPGITGSPDFPTTPGAYDTTFHGVGGPAPPPFGPGDFDAYLTKLAPDGSRLEYSTFLGGSRLDVGFEVEVSLLGDAYVAGLTLSPDFPTTPGAYDRTLGGPYDAYVTKFSRDGSAVVYSTLLGGSGTDGALGLALDPLGSAYVSGGTASPDFPTTPGAFDRTFNGPTDVFVTKLLPDGSGLAYSTFLGGGGPDGSSGLAVNRLGEAYVTGETTSADFPTTPDALATTLRGGSDAFLTQLTSTGTGLVYSTYLGGYDYDSGADVAVDLRTGAAYVTGVTYSPDFPTTPGAFDPTFNGNSDAFVSMFSPTGRRTR
ncbi:MAG: SBBP repeat-containing protein, partial [Actinobacteria bacterium]|nr:SBBP repeat-containing protein [Actinomycetota bacterium]